MSFLKDPYTYLTTGFVIMVDIIAAYINPIVSVLIGFGGLVTVVMGMHHRRKKYRLEIKIKEAELRRLEQDIRK